MNNIEIYSPTKTTKLFILPLICIIDLQPTPYPYQLGFFEWFNLYDRIFAPTIGKLHHIF